MPASLVGPAASARLQGGGGLVASLDANLVALADGRIVSNHSGSILSNHGGSLVSDQGGGLISDQGGAAVGSSRARRLLQSSAAPLASQGQVELWGMLSALDLIDQSIQGALLAQPSLGRWSRFRCPQMELLPLPPRNEPLALVVQGLTAKLRAMELAVLVTQEAQGLHLRLSILPEAEAPLAEGRRYLDLTSDGKGGALAHARFPAVLEELFGMAQARLRLAWGPGSWVLETGEDFLPRAARGPVAQALETGDNSYVVIQRRWHFGALAQPREWLQVFQSDMTLTPKGELRVSQALNGWDFAGPNEADVGLANYGRARGSFHPMPPDQPFRWGGQQDELDAHPVRPLLGRYVLPDGTETNQAPPALQALMPPFDEAWLAQLIPPPDPAASASQAATLLGPAWPGELWTLPEAP